MRQSNTFQTKTNSESRKSMAAFATLIMFLETQSVNAQSTTQSVNIFIGMQYGLSMIIPIVGAIILLFLLIIYVFRLITRATFIRWTFSVIIAGAAFYISNILFHIN
ncbi:conjugal transfer protein [Bartonella gliris]|uniref:conjugal transfer protein n=1 Tax=Bartonella gliris TaxID=3004109 RepID=UPI00295F409B|nr:conjugal transfer protein [Bartonella gliris]